MSCINQHYGLYDVISASAHPQNTSAIVTMCNADDQKSQLASVSALILLALICSCYKHPGTKAICNLVRVSYSQIKSLLLAANMRKAL